MKVSTIKRISGIMIAILVLAAYILPYTLFTNVRDWYGSFLIWGIIGVLIISFNLLATKDWEE